LNDKYCMNANNVDTAYKPKQYWFYKYCMNANNVDTAYKPKQYWFYCQTACNIKIISVIKKFVYRCLAEINWKVYNCYYTSIFMDNLESN